MFVACEPSLSSAVRAYLNVNICLLARHNCCGFHRQIQASQGGSGVQGQLHETGSRGLQQDAPNNTPTSVMALQQDECHLHTNTGQLAAQVAGDLLLLPAGMAAQAPQAPPISRRKGHSQGRGTGAPLPHARGVQRPHACPLRLCTLHERDRGGGAVLQ